MVSRISVNVEKSQFSKVVTKKFQRNLQEIETKAAYYEGSLYYKEWIVKAHGTLKRYIQSYSDNKAIKGSRHIIDYKA